MSEKGCLKLGTLGVTAPPTHTHRTMSTTCKETGHSKHLMSTRQPKAVSEEEDRQGLRRTDSGPPEWASSFLQG